MEPTYRTGLGEQIDAVFRAHPQLFDHRGSFPWLTGALGDPTKGIWFIGENPSLGQMERVLDPLGGPPTEQAQWWASRGDRLFRDLLVRHGFKTAPAESHGGWRCYITNVIKEADYAEKWRGSPAERRRAAAEAWSPVLRWELEQSRPLLVVALGKTVRDILSGLEAFGLRFPRIETVQHYSYVAFRPRGTQGPMHPDRIRDYDDEFALLAFRIGPFAAGYVTSHGLRSDLRVAYADGVPTLLRLGPHRVYFHSHEPHEPSHVHVDRDACSAKFWLNPVRRARNLGFSAFELRRIERLVVQWERVFLEAWNEYF